MESVDTTRFQQELLDNLTGNILPYWMDNMTDPRGGFYGHRDGNDRLDPNAPKGAILNARILWAFSAAYRQIQNPAYLDSATRAYEYIRDHFVDYDLGGVYWSLHADGTPLDTKKQSYAIGFAIYGLSEYVRASGSTEALALAKRLCDDLECHALDCQYGGYTEALTREWIPIDDMRLSDKDANCSKTMNTHLHIIEPYTNLYRIWPDSRLREAIERMMRLFLDVIQDNESNHLGLFFSDDWVRQDGSESYGHDIEASWLLLETAQVLGDESLLNRTLSHTHAIADAALEGRLDNGAMVYERTDDGHLDTDIHWWVQAEDVIGLLYLWKYHQIAPALEKAWQSWQFIKSHLVDNERGEWLWSVHADLTPDRSQARAGFWKCPYHNSRMCLEAARVLSL